jgi:hypothetical protein
MKVTTLIDADKRLLGYSDVAYVTCGNSQIVQLEDKFRGILVSDGNEKSTGGLGIKK